MLSRRTLSRPEGSERRALGAGVGGGSLVYNAIIGKPRRELVERIFPRAIDFDEMEDVYYPRVKGIIGSAPIPDDVLSSVYYTSSRVSLEQAQTAGFPTRPVDLAVDWDIVRQEMAGTRVASAIAGQSWYGLNSGAKRSLDQNYLAQAEATGARRDLVQHLTRVDLLVLEDFGMKKLGPTAAEDLLEIFVRRHETASTLITTNRPTQDWGVFLGDVPAATAILDRFLAHATLVQMTGKSYRLRQRSSTADD